MLTVGTGTWGIAAVIPKYLSLRLHCDYTAKIHINNVIRKFLWKKINDLSL